jgi:hypothetical protein
MDEERKRRSRLRSVALGGALGAAGTIATVRRLRRRRFVSVATGLAAFEDAPCFIELHGAPDEAVDRPR